MNTIVNIPNTYVWIAPEKKSKYACRNAGIPIFLPINIISEFATPVSMSLRLFGNVTAGTIMLGLWYALMPWFAKIGIPAFLHAYFDFFSGAIQTYVFGMLTMVFVANRYE